MLHRPWREQASPFAPRGHAGGVAQSSPRQPSRQRHSPRTHSPLPEQSLGQMPTSHRAPLHPAKHSHCRPLHRPLKPHGSAPTPFAYGLAHGCSAASGAAAGEEEWTAPTLQSSPDHAAWQWQRPE